MKVCQTCGQPMEDDELFCSSCGAKEETPQPEAAPEEGGFCPNCGQPFEGGTIFCPNCGANTQTGEAPSAVSPTAAPRKALNPKVIGMVAIAAAALVVVGLVGFLATNVFASPASKFVSYQRQMLLDSGLTQLVEMADQVNNYGSFSTDMTITASSDSAELEDYLDDSSITFKAALSKNALVANGELRVNGASVLTGAATYDKGVVGLYLPDLDDTYYTMDLARYTENMGIDDLSQFEIPSIPSATLNKLGKTYLNILLGTVNKDNIIVSERKQFRLEQLGKKLDGTLYLFQPTAEDIESMILKLADTVEKDADLRSFLIDLIGKNEAMAQRIFNIKDVENSLDGDLVDMAENLRDNAEYIGDSLEDSGFVWAMGVSDGRVCLQSLTWDGGDNGMVYESYGDEKQGCHDLFYIKQYGDMDGSVDLEWRKDGSTYSGQVSLNNAYSDSPMASLTFDDVDLGKKSILGLNYGSYKVSVSDGYSDTAVRLALEVEKPSKGGGTDHVFELSNLVGYGDFELTLHTTDKKSTAAKPRANTQDISDYSDTDFYNLTNKLSEAFQRNILPRINNYGY